MENIQDELVDDQYKYEHTFIKFGLRGLHGYKIKVYDSCI